MTQATTVRDCVAQARARLEQAGVDSPALSAEILTAHVLGMRRLDILVHADKAVAAPDLARIQECVERRAAGEPVAYLLGEKEFFGYDFYVDRFTLVPRPETELLIEAVQSIFPRDAAFQFADLGTGSGCIAVTLALEFPGAQGCALDLSEGALAVAQKNAERHGVASRVEMRHADFGSDFAPEASLDLIVSNPPYVSEDEYAEVSVEVADFEPKTALVPAEGEGRSDGLECVRRLAPHVARLLRPGGWFLMEYGWKQGPAVAEILGAVSEFQTVKICKDLAGLDRYVVAQKRV